MHVVAIIKTFKDVAGKDWTAGQCGWRFSGKILTIGSIQLHYFLIAGEPAKPSAATAEKYRSSSDPIIPGEGECDELWERW